MQESKIEDYESKINDLVGNKKIFSEIQSMLDLNFKLFKLSGSAARSYITVLRWVRVT